MVRAAVLVLLLAATALADEAASARRYVNIEKNARGERKVLPAWKTYADMKACAEYGARRLRAGAGNQAFQGGPCVDGRAADLAHGTAVDVLPHDEATCGPLAKVHVVAGDASGRTACVPPEQLSRDPVP